MDIIAYVFIIFGHFGTKIKHYHMLKIRIRSKDNLARLTRKGDHYNMGKSTINPLFVFDDVQVKHSFTLKSIVSYISL